MSYLGIVFTFVFGGNVLFRFGAGACSCYSGRQGGGSWPAFLALATVSLISATLHSSIMRYALYPLGLEALEPLSYVLVVATLLYALSSALASGGGGFLAESGRLAKDQVFSCVVYAASLSAAREGFTIAEAAAAGFAATLGWWFAVVLLNRIMERLELEDVPPSLNGMPLRFLSAGLMAMAVSGIDRLLISRIAG